MPRGWRPLLPRLRRWSRVVSPVACAPGVFDAPNREADRLVLIRAGIFKGFEVSEDLKVVERDVEGPLDLFEEIVTALNRPLTRDEDVHGDELEVARLPSPDAVERDLLAGEVIDRREELIDRKSTRLNSSH